MILKINFTSIENILFVCYILLVFIAIVMIIRDRRDPVSAFLWILIITLLPFIGLIFYLFIGRNHRKRKIFNIKKLDEFDILKKFCDKQFNELNNNNSDNLAPIEYNRYIINLLLNNSSSPLTIHNDVKILNDGQGKFSNLLDDLKSAKESIHIEYYIFDHDRIGNHIMQVLREKAAEGVEVRIIYDDFGSWSFKRKYAKELSSSGIESHPFIPVSFPWISSKIYCRNHRKIIVIDGKIGFTGGVNIADRYIKGTNFGHWRDIHLRIQGEAVAMLQAVFVSDWLFVSRQKQLLTDLKYFPKNEIEKVSPLQIASSGPDSDWSSIMQVFFAAISNARKYIYLSTPYFIPSQPILMALKVASLSGVDIRIILPHRSDSKVAYWASRSYICEMLQAGIKVYFYQKGFNHSKLLIVDDMFSSVGSANMDYRSFDDNYETSAMMYDPEISAELTRDFMQDIEDSILITTEEWEKRSTLHATYESLARLFSPLL